MTSTGMRTLAGLALLASACAARTPVRPVVDRTPAPVISPVKAAPGPAPPRPWAVAFARTCAGSITLPVIAPDRSFFALCGARFDFTRGSYLGELVGGALAVLPGDLLLRVSYNGEGLVLGPLDDGRTTTGRSGGGFVEAAAIAGDQTRVLAIQREGDASEVALYSLPELERLARAPLAGRVRDAQLGFLADGTPLVAAAHGCVTRPIACSDGSQGCRDTKCAGSGVQRLADGQLVPLGGAFAGVRAMAVAASGERAVLAHEDGTRSLVALPSGEALAALPPLTAGHEDSRALALDPAGTRVAFADGDGLVIAAISTQAGAGGAALVELARAAEIGESVLGFSPDGRSLFATAWGQTVVLREGEPVHPARVPSYAPIVPKGVQTSVLAREESGLVDRVLERGEVVQEEALAPEVFARHRGRDVVVTALALDPAEFGGPELGLAEWSARVLARAGFSADIVKDLRMWGAAGSRSLEYTYFRREGCLPIDQYIRVSERAGIAYRIEIEVPPGTPSRKVAPLVAAFFDQPLGAPEQARRFVPPGRVARGGC